MLNFTHRFSGTYIKTTNESKIWYYKLASEICSHLLCSYILLGDWCIAQEHLTNCFSKKSVSLACSSNQEKLQLALWLRRVNSSDEYIQTFVLIKRCDWQFLQLKEEFKASIVYWYSLLFEKYNKVSCWLRCTFGLPAWRICTLKVHLVTSW